MPVPSVAHTHSGQDRKSWVTVEIDAGIVMSEAVVKGALRHDCSKTQYLRTLVAKALLASKLPVLAAFAAVTQ